MRNNRTVSRRAAEHAEKKNLVLGVGKNGALATSHELGRRPAYGDDVGPVLSETKRKHFSACSAALRETVLGSWALWLTSEAMAVTCDL
jgi:hypothetical protein